MKQYVSIMGLVVVLCLIAIGFSYLAKLHPSAPQEQAQKSSILEAPLNGIDYEYTEEKPYYSIKAVFPSTAPQSVERAIADTIAQFKNDSNLDHLTAEDIQVQGLGGDRKYTLDIDTTTYTGASSTSYVLSIYQDTLGAHPNGFYRTLTFGEGDIEITLENLFKSNSKYLDRLSASAYKTVVAELTVRTDTKPDESMLDTVRIGTSPSPEALQFFYIDGTDLHLLFPPYQVAAYAAGSFDIAIPLASLKDILK